MPNIQTAALEDGRCGIPDLAIKPHPTISPTISQAIRFSQDGGGLAAAFRAALARKAVAA